jgi:LAS superfamily LD-carboxypeptidase LdcB
VAALEGDRPGKKPIKKPAPKKPAAKPNVKKPQLPYGGAVQQKAAANKPAPKKPAPKPGKAQPLLVPPSLIGRSGDENRNRVGPGRGAPAKLEIQVRLELLMAEAIKAFPGQALGVTSMTRSTQRQTELWNAALKKYGSAAAARKWVAPPGSSNHEKGCACDLNFTGGSNGAFARWVRANAQRFGLHFPLSNEPWHIELQETRGGGLSREAVARGLKPADLTWQATLARQGAGVDIKGQSIKPNPMAAAESGGRAAAGAGGGGGGAAGGGGGGGAMGAAGAGFAGGPTLSMEELASQYGFAAALFQSDPELSKLIADAVAGQWAPEKFQAKLRATNWYKTRTDAQRQFDERKARDPQSANREIEVATAEFRRQASELGVPVSDGDLRSMAETFVRNGESTNSTLVRNAITAQLRFTEGTDFGGEAGATQDELTALFKAYGLPADAAWVGRKTVDVLQGKATLEDVQNYAKNMAKTLYPALAKQIDSGMTVEEFAQPYRSTLGQVLELNADEVDLSADPLLRQALSGVGEPGKERAPMALWDFETRLRRDARWMKTNNARDSLVGVAGQVLRDFGFRS